MTTRLDFPGIASQAFVGGDAEAGRILAEVESFREARTSFFCDALRELGALIESGDVLFEDIAEELLTLVELVDESNS